MKKIIITILFLLSLGIAYSQGLDTIPLRSIYINDFCLGDSVNKLYEVFGIPQETETGVVDEAIENTQPSKNIYYYGKFSYFSEPYEISRGRIGEFHNFMNDSVNMELRIVVDNKEIAFRIGDTLDIKDIKSFFPKSFNYMKTESLNFTNKDAYLYLIPSEQENYFKFPYPFVTLLTVQYSDNIIIGFYSRYFSE